MAVPLSLVVFFASLVAVFSFPNGAPKELCGSPLGRPVHNNTLPQSTCSPFVISVNSTTYTPNVPVNVTIHGNGAIFRGFLITADTTTGMFDGTCLNTDNSAKAVPNCGMTHTDNSNKTVVTLLWYPPLLVHVGNVQFKLVVVENFNTYWSDIRSLVLKPNDVEYYSIKDIVNMSASQQQHKQHNRPAHSNGHFQPTNTRGQFP